MLTRRISEEHVMTTLQFLESTDPFKIVIGIMRERDRAGKAED